MSQFPMMPVETSRRRWQFSILGMLLFTASVAVGLSVWQAKLFCWSSYGTTVYLETHKFMESGWSSGILAVFIFWMAFGIVFQIRDLWSCLAANPHINQEQKLGLRFEIFWRAAIIFLLASFVLLAVLLNQGLVTLPERDDYNGWGDSNVTREAIFLLLLIVIVGSVPHPSNKPKWTPLYWIFNLIACALAIKLALNRWMEQTYLHHLINVSTVEMDMAFPLRYSAIDSFHYREQCLFFSRWSKISAVLVLFNWMCLWLLARQWTDGIVRRRLWAVLLFSGITATSSYVFWIFCRGLRKVSPYFAEAGITQPFHYWISTVLLLLILITIIAYQLAVDKPRSLQASSLWRRNSGKYYHEWRSILLGLACTIACFRIHWSYAAHRLNASWMFTVYDGRFYRMPKSCFSWQFIMDTFFCGPMDFLWTGLLILAFLRAFAPRLDSNHLQVDTPSITRAKFATIWLATAAFAVSGVLTLVWMSFSLWLTRY